MCFCVCLCVCGGGGDSTKLFILNSMLTYPATFRFTFTLVQFSSSTYPNPFPSRHLPGPSLLLQPLSTPPFPSLLFIPYCLLDPFPTSSCLTFLALPSNPIPPIPFHFPPLAFPPLTTPPCLLSPRYLLVIPSPTLSPYRLFLVACQFCPFLPSRLTVSETSPACIFYSSHPLPPGRLPS